MMFHHRNAVRAAAGAILLLCAATAALAQSWPAKPITIVVAYPAGGDTDAIARTYAEKLAQRIGQPVLVDNRPGASGMIGNAWVAKAPADGYTLLFTPSTFPIAQHVLKAGPGVAHDVVKDFTPIVKTGNIPVLMVTSPTSGIRNVAQLVAGAKAGKAYTYGTPGAGSPMHIAGELFNKDAGIAVAHAPYRGVAPVVNDTLGGHVSVGWITPGAVAGHIAAGKLVPLAVAERQRTKLMPNVPTFLELGYRDMDVSAWMGLLGPKALPAEVVQTLNRHFNEILKMPDVQARMAALGIEPVGGAPSVLARQIADDDQRFGALVREFGIRAE
ncbi:Bug family tripartite tricarboxylate transporter substrate binding protein [Acidovorax cavernicola]|uniref:Tripartite tricarboxylate transporter substrate binding protein n=1 Tax=Acidovorax cavernicola TaxID=1675792 RepID=A0A9X8GTC4_9BURK|nr:tripartite tricarboxylate transporter substrate binding protein [Acidovorax cavernicola]RIX75818.1 tripartite tricarboxylate transporter substrate binding protein [Acidovorax cavernicola]